MACDVIVVCAS